MSMPTTPEVMLSSTLRGAEMTTLRAAAIEGIRIARCAASACEDWGATPHSTLDESIAQVRGANIYLLVLGARYGTACSATDQRSFTEVEFDEAASAGKPRLAFIQDPFVVESASDPEETGRQVALRERFKRKVMASGVTVKPFATAEELRLWVSIALLRETLSDRANAPSTGRVEVSDARRFHVVHEYTLLDTDLAGRAKQLETLTTWAGSRNPIMVIEAFGGFGKTAMSWWWWETQKELTSWKGGVWFSFYEPGATMSEFFAQVFSHLAREPLEETRKRPTSDLEKLTLQLLREESCLIVMDGLERMLTRNTSLNANEEEREERTSDRQHSATTAQPEAEGSRAIQDRLLSRWLVKVANGSASKILITSRYFPSDLEKVATPRRGVDLLKLGGLNVEEARAYWRSIGLNAEDPGLERLVRGVHGHPLTLSVMAGILRSSAVRSLGEFFEQRPGFPVFRRTVRPADGRDDVFQSALAHLSEGARALLGIVALHAVPVPLRDLRELTCDSGSSTRTDDFIVPDSGPADAALQTVAEVLFHDEDEFLSALLDLEDRRLITRSADNVCDLHPVIRSVVRERSSTGDLEASDKRIVEYYSGAPKPWFVTETRQLFPQIQLVFSATRRKMWPRALELFAEYLREHLTRLNEWRLIASIATQFYTIEKTPQGVALSWTVGSRLPQIVLPRTLTVKDRYGAGVFEAWAEDLRKKHQFSEEEIYAYRTQNALSMIAGKAYESLGEFDIAKALFESHNRCCPEPLCRTMQDRCYEQSGRFGEASRLLSDGIQLFGKRGYWRRDPFELRRLSVDLFYDCVDRDLVGDARITFARENNIVRTFGRSAFDAAYSEDEWLRARNLRVARLACAERHTAIAVSICREVVEHAFERRDERDHVSALRVFADILRVDGRFEEAREIYDRLVSMDPDGAQQGRALDDRARRARNRIALRQFDEARHELDDVIAMARSAKATSAECLIFKSELFRAEGNVASEIACLVEALNHYALFPGTPIDVWGVRTCLNRLHELNADNKATRQRKHFVERPAWSRELLFGTDKAKPSAKDLTFPLEAVWSLPETQRKRNGSSFPASSRTRSKKPRRPGRPRAR